MSNDFADERLLPDDLPDLDAKKYERLRGSESLGFLVRKLKSGFSPTMLIVGGTRMGKSLTAMWIAEQIAERMNWKWDLDESYFYGIKRFMEEITTIHSRVVIIDEIGVDLDAHEWFSMFNLTFNHIMQTQALKNNLYLLVIPYAKYIAKVHIPLIDLIGEKIRRERLSVFRINPAYSEFRASKFVWRYYIETLKDIPLPPKKILDRFKEIEKENKAELERRILKKLKDVKEKESDEMPQLFNLS